MNPNYCEAEHAYRVLRSVPPGPAEPAEPCPPSYPCDGCGELVQVGEHVGTDPDYLCTDCYLPDCYPEPFPA